MGTSLYQQYLREKGDGGQAEQAPQATPLYEQYRREKAQGGGDSAAPAPIPSQADSAAPAVTPAPRRERLDPAALAARVREGISRVQAGSDVTSAPPQSDEQRTAASVPVLPYLPRQVRGAVADAAHAVRHPIETGKSIVREAVHSAKDAFSPVLPEDADPSLRALFPNAVTPRENRLGIINTTANVLLPKIPVGGIAGRAAVNTALGAVNSPEGERVRGATGGLLLGELLHQGTELAGPVARKVGGRTLDNVREVGERVSERIRAEREARAARQQVGLTEKPPTPAVPPAEAPPTPPEDRRASTERRESQVPVGTERRGIRQRIAETIDPTIKERIAAAEQNPVTGLPGRAPFDRDLPAVEADPGMSVVRGDFNGTKALNDTMGHPYTDAEFRRVAAAMNQAAEELGIEPKNYHPPGGDEFMAAVPTEKAEAFGKRVSELYGVREHAPGVKSSISFGHGQTEVAADAAAYAQKKLDKAAQGIPDRDAPTTGAADGVQDDRTVRTVPIGDIDVEPERFQHREQVDAKTGVKKRLEGPFERDFSDVMMVWRDPADGRLKLVNGHHRFDLAKSERRRTVDIREIQADSPEAAKLQGALANIFGGNASPFEAAAVFRDSGLTPDDLRARKLPISKGLVDQGMAIAKLAPDLWEQTRKGELSEAVAAGIGKVLDSHEQQRAAVKLIGDERLSLAEAESVAREVRDAGSESVTQETLFGSEETTLSLAVPKAKLIGAVKKAIGRDARNFGFVAKEGRAEELARAGNIINREESARIAQDAAQSAELFDRLATRAGPVSQILTEGARRVARGERLAAVAADIRPQLREAISEALGRGEGESATGSQPAARAVEEGPRAGGEEGEVAPPDPNQSGFFDPGEEPERITAAAVRTRDGRVFQGPLHAEAREAAEKAGALTDYEPGEHRGDNGFVTSRGRFVSREEALQLARAAKQRVTPEPGEKGLDAMDLPMREREKMPRGEVKPEPNEFNGIERGKPGIAIEPQEGGVTVVARNKAGEPIGFLSLEEVNEGVFRAHDVHVAPGERRKGVATSLYRAAKDAGMDIVSGDMGLSEEGAALVGRLADEGTVRAARRTPNMGGERITAATVKMPDGRIFPGLQHGDAVEMAEALGYPDAAEVGEMGFATNRREHVTREEAARIADEAGQAFTPEDWGAPVSGPRALDAEEVLGSILEDQRNRPLADPNLFGEETGTGPAQESFFGGKEGTAAARNLSQTEAAARAELPKLKEQLRLEKDRGRRASIAARIAKLEALVNRGEKIGAEEGAARAVAKSAENTDAPVAGEDQQTLFAAASSGSPLAAQVGKLLGASAGQMDRVKALSEIGRELSQAVGVPTRQGRFLAGARKALGAFFPMKKVSRVIRLDKLDTIAHEIGHYVSQEHLGNPTMHQSLGRTRRSVTPQMKAELVKMGKDLYGSRQPAGGYGEEGIAQWFRFYVTDPARMLKESPNFSAFMDHLFAAEPDMTYLKAALDRARGDFDLWRKAPPQARVRSMISVNERTRWRPTVRGIVAAMLDDLNEFAVAEKEIARAFGGKITVAARKSAYSLARLSRGAAGMAEEMVERGIAEPDNPAAKRTSEGLHRILEEVGRKNIDDFRDYVVAERVMELAGRGIDSGFNVSDARKIVAQFGTKFKGSAAKLWTYGQALIEYRRDAGLLTPQEAAAILKQNQRYVPFQRLFHEGETGVSAGKGGGRSRFAYNSSGIQSIKGSGRPIIDPFESLIEQTYRTVRDVQQHRAAQALIEMSNNTPGGGQVVERLTERPTQRIELNVTEVADQLQSLGFQIDPNMTPAELQRMAEGVLVGFRELRVGGAAEAKDLVIPVIENGKRQWYAVKDRPLFEALQGLGTQTMPTWVRVLSFPARTLRTGATLTLEFLGRNPARDAWSAAIYSQAGHRPPGWNLAKGLFHALRQDGAYQRWRLGGGDNATMLGLDRPQVQKHLADVMKNRTPITYAVDVVRHPIDTLRMLSSLGENASRLGEFVAVEAKRLKEGASAADAATDAALASRNVTLDFARAGTQGRMINQIVAFFNANLQGTAKLASELKNRPHVVIPRAVAGITIPSIALYMMNKDDPAYQELPQWQKDTFWIVIQRDEQGKLEHLWRVPKPFELGVLFGTVPERIMQRIEKDDPDAFHELGNRLMQTFSPISWPLTGSALSPIVENWANRDAFTDRPIVPGSTEDLIPSEQVAPHTGEAARQVGRLTNSSPAKVEHLVKGYTAGLGQIALQGANAATRAGRKALDLPPLTAPLARHERDALASAPGVRAFVARPPGTDAESISRFYDAFESAESHRKTYGALVKARRMDEARAFMKKHRKEIATVATGAHPGRLREVKSKMDDLRKAMREAQAGAPTAARARSIEHLEDQMIRLAQLALGKPMTGGR